MDSGGKNAQKSHASVCKRVAPHPGVFLGLRSLTKHKKAQKIMKGTNKIFESRITKIWESLHKVQGMRAGDRGHFLPKVFSSVAFYVGLNGLSAPKIEKKPAFSLRQYILCGMKHGEKTSWCLGLGKIQAQLQFFCVFGNTITEKRTHLKTKYTCVLL